ncbi:MAG: hypothetical protein WAL50_12655 [Kineosporiaceae bacterium]|jgi:MFS family permease
MASLLVTGGKVGGIIGRRRAFVLGCVIYGGAVAIAVGSVVCG